MVKAPVSSGPAGQRAGPVRLPKHLQQQCRDHRVDVDAVDGARHAALEHRLNQLAIVLVKDVIVAVLHHELTQPDLARVQINRLILEHRMIQPGDLLKYQDLPLDFLVDL